MHCIEYYSTGQGRTVQYRTVQYREVDGGALEILRGKGRSRVGVGVAGCRKEFGSFAWANKLMFH